MLAAKLTEPAIEPLPASVLAALRATGLAPVAEPEVLFTINKPPLTVVPPLYVLAPVSVDP